MSFAREGELGEEPVQGMTGVCYAKVWQAALGIQKRQVKGREGTGPRQPHPVLPFLFFFFLYSMFLLVIYFIHISMALP